MTDENQDPITDIDGSQSTAIDPADQAPDIVDTGNLAPSPRVDEPTTGTKPATNIPQTPTTSMGPNIDRDVLDDMHSFPSVDKKQFFQERDDLFAKIKSADATVYQGNFVSEYAEKTYRNLTIKNLQTVSHAAEFLGDTGIEMGGADSNNRANIVGHRIRNFGFFVAGKAKDMLEQRRKTNPVNEGNDAAGLAADVTSNILTSIAVVLGAKAAATAAGASAPLAIVAGSAVAGGVFGTQAGVDMYSASREAGNDYKSSLAFGVLNGAVTAGLQAFGLNKVFGMTYGKGISIARQAVLDSAASLGIVSGLQTMVQLGLNKAAGIGKPITLQEFISQTIYASAVGAFSGGIMTAAVVLPMRGKAIDALRQAGMDNEQAKTTYKEINQKVMDHVQNTVAKKLNFTEAQNEITQKAFDIRADYLNSRVYPKEQFLRDINQMKQSDNANEVLDPLAARSAAEVRGAGLPDSRIPGAKQTIVIIQTMEQAESSTKELNTFEVKQPEWNVNVEPATRKIIEGRINQLNEENKTLWKQYLDLQKELEEAKYGSPNKSTSIKVDELQQRETDLQKKIMDNFTEATALSYDKSGADMKGNELKLRARDLIQITAEFAKQIIKAAEQNFKNGRLATRAEFRFIRESLNRLINAPGLSKETRALLKWRYSQLTTAEDLYKNVPLILDAVQEAQNDSFVTGIKIGVDKLVNFFKGGSGGRAGLRDVKLDADSQKVADAFVNEYENENTNPTERQKLLGSEPEKIMRFLASMLKTGKNGLGQELQPRDYASMYQVLFDFAKNGRDAAVFDALRLKQYKENMRAQAIKDILGNKTEITKPMGNADIFDLVAAVMNKLVGTYDTLLGLLARHSGKMMGASFIENALSAHNGQRISEAFHMFFLSEHNNAIVDSFPELNGNRKNIRAWKMQDSQQTGGNSIHFTYEEAGGTPEKPGKQISVDLSRGAAREKLALSLRPEGEKALRRMGWTDETFEKLNASLRPEDIDYVSRQIKLYGDIFEHLNEVFRKIAGYDLPRSKNYSPLISDRDVINGISMVAHLFGEDDQHSPSIQSQSFFKEATGNAKLRDIEDFLKLDKYIHDATHYIGTAETVERMRGVFGDSDVRDAIRSRYGEDPLVAVDRYTKVLTENSINTGQNKMWASANNALTRLAQGFIYGKPTQILKHLTHMFAGMEITGISKYFEGLSTLAKAFQSGEIRELTDSPYMRARGQLRSLSRDTRLISEAQEFDNSHSIIDLLPGNTEATKAVVRSLKKLADNPTFNDIMILPTQLGDFGGLVASTWPVYKYYQELITKADPSKSVEQVKGEALMAAIKNADATQQSPDFTQNPAWMLDNNPGMRLLSLFKQAPYQYMNRVLRILQNMGTDRWNWTEIGKAYGIFFLLLPSLFDYVSQAFNPRHDQGWGSYSAERVMIGPFDEMAIMGPLLEWTVLNLVAGTTSLITGEEYKEKKLDVSDMAGLGVTMFDSIQQAVQSVKKAADADWDAELTAHMITKLTEASYPVTGAVGALTRDISNSVDGIMLGNQGDLVDTWRRYLMILGYGKGATNPPKDQ